MGAGAEGFHAETAGTAAELHSGGIQLAQPGGHFLVAAEVCVGVVGDHIGSGAALDGHQLQGAGLGVGAGEGGVDDALFAVDHGVLAVGGEAHDGHFSALGQVILHILGAGLLVAAQQDTDPAADRQTAVTNCGQRIEGCNGGAFVVGGATAPERIREGDKGRHLRKRPTELGVLG